MFDFKEISTIVYLINRTPIKSCVDQGKQEKSNRSSFKSKRMFCTNKYFCYKNGTVKHRTKMVLLLNIESYFNFKDFFATRNNQFCNFFAYYKHFGLRIY